MLIYITNSRFKVYIYAHVNASDYEETRTPSKETKGS